MIDGHYKLEVANCDGALDLVHKYLIWGYNGINNLSNYDSSWIQWNESLFHERNALWYIRKQRAIRTRLKNL